MRNFKCVLVSVAVAAICVCGPVQAQDRQATTIENMLYWKDNGRNKSTESLLIGIMRGIDMTNQYLRVTDKKPIYCEPPGISLRPTQLIALLQGAVQKNPEWGKEDILGVGIIMLTVLKETFPCKE